MFPSIYRMKTMQTLLRRVVEPRSIYVGATGGEDREEYLTDELRVILAITEASSLQEGVVSEEH